jgi:flagellar biosynthesis GTPase FlhF
MHHFLPGLAALLLLIPASGLDDYLAVMKTTKTGVQDYIESSIMYGSFSFPSACRAIPKEKRAAVVRAVGDFARTFVKTDTFKKAYAELREQRKPSKPEATPLSAETRKRQIAELKVTIAEQEKAQASAPAEQKGIFKDILTSLRSMVKQLETQDKSQDAQMDEFIKQSNAMAMQQYNEKVASFEKEYPAGDPKPLIRKRLQEFLKASASVDYDARLVKKDKQWIFQNPAYENKDRNWKLAYRAGKEATEAARAFATEWLKEF